MNLKEFAEENGQTATANLIGVTQGLVSRWVNGKQAIPVERAILIHAATKGKVKKHEMRPDFFPAPKRKVA